MGVKIFYAIGDKMFRLQSNDLTISFNDVMITGVLPAKLLFPIAADVFNFCVGLGGSAMHDDVTDLSVHCC